MIRRIALIVGAVTLNALFVFVAISPEFVTFAQVAPPGVTTLTEAADAGRNQVLGLIRGMHKELLVLAAANVGLTFFALWRRGPA